MESRDGMGHSSVRECSLPTARRLADICLPVIFFPFLAEGMAEQSTYTGVLHRSSSFPQTRSLGSKLTALGLAGAGDFTQCPAAAFGVNTTLHAVTSPLSDHFRHRPAQH